MTTPVPTPILHASGTDKALDVAHEQDEAVGSKSVRSQDPKVAVCPSARLWLVLLIVFFSHQWLIELNSAYSASCMIEC